MMLRQVTIHTRLLAAFGALVALILLVSAIAFIGSAAQHSAFERFDTVMTQQLQRALEIEVLVRDARALEKAAALNYYAPTKSGEIAARWEKAQQSLNAEVARWASGDGGASVAALSASLTEYQAEVRKVFKQVGNSAYASADEVVKDLGAAEPHFERLLAATDKVVQEAQTLRDTLAQENNATARTVRAVAIVLSVLALAGGGLLALFVWRSICTPLQEATQLAHQISQGKLTERLHVQGRDESAVLQRALLAMQEVLASMVRDMRQASVSVHESCTEISSGTMDLSTRTEQTSSRLQEAASSLQQLASEATQSAASASAAARAAKTAQTLAEGGGEVVGLVVSSMQGITQNANRINDIVGVIDGIAFQTNILALNAAVEAARAGEQGRGFAVVAGEVRSLAQRAAKAAGEIKTLISTSNAHVEQGAALVDKAGDAMKDIVSGVVEMSSTLQGIAATTQSQSHGLAVLSDSIGEVDGMTQQNAALVEQSAAASDSLKTQAESMRAAVQRFEVDASPA